MANKTVVEFKLSPDEKKLVTLFRELKAAKKREAEAEELKGSYELTEEIDSILHPEDDEDDFGFK